MDNGYLGGIIIAGTLLLMAFAYWQFRRLQPSRLLDNETAATIVGFLLTAALAFGITVFAGNAYMTDTFSTIVSSIMVAAAFLVLAVTISRTRTTPAVLVEESNTPAPFTPETPAANANKPTPGRNRSRRKAA